MEVFKLIISVVLAYLIGGIQTSILMSRSMHGDIRKFGSGNAGATNMLRVYGVKAGLFTLLCDFVKAFIAVGICLLLFLGANDTYIAHLSVYASGLCVVLGHNFPIYFGFRGGKGVATSLAVMWAVYGMYMGDWIIPVLTTVIGIIMIAITRMVSVGSITGAIVQLSACLIIYANNDVAACVLSFVLFAMLCLRHSKNIVRIVHGEEKKLSFSKSKDKAENAEAKNEESEDTEEASAKVD